MAWVLLNELNLDTCLHINDFVKLKKIHNDVMNELINSYWTIWVKRYNKIEASCLCIPNYKSILFTNISINDYLVLKPTYSHRRIYNIINYPKYYDSKEEKILLKFDLNFD